MQVLPDHQLEEMPSEMSFRGRSILAIGDLSKQEILSILETGKRYEHCDCSSFLKGKILVNCFFESSTRTRLSFESAMHRLGGNVIGFSDSSMISVKKGESLYDTMKIVENYADIIVIRHPLEGAAQRAAESVNIPVINAGDGANEHPTQTLLDLYTIQKTHGTLENLSIAMVGDLKHGRTVHSLARACVHFGIRLYFVSPPMLEMPREICNFLREKGVKFSFHRNIEDILKKIDVLYMTRIQEERFVDKQEYLSVKNLYRLTDAHFDEVKENLKIMHPLPRNDEIDVSVDSTKYAVYFDQALNGLHIRKALLAMLLGK